MVDYTTFPKIELHLHLDCSLSYDVVKAIRPDISLEEYRSHYLFPSKCTDLADYLHRAYSGVRLMQSAKNIRLVILDLFQQLKSDNVIYAELRFAPLQHLEQDLDSETVVETARNAIREGSELTGVKASLILCTLRHFSKAQSMETVKLVKKHMDDIIVGFDIAADEAGHPIDNHIKAFDFANRENIPCTAHAGEAKGPESVWETLDHFHPSRIGHGVRSIEDPRLIQYLKDKNIHLEVCPVSNVIINIVDKIENHPIDSLFKQDVSLSINTDARALMNNDLASEYAILSKVFNWSKEDFLKCNLEAINHAFTDNETKDKLRQRIISAYRN
ncbi:MAG: adenosine deaminase [Saprospiraceae bacterium]|nr:adenosine deaminase [Bacteroidia bacterium]NNK89613.1 adenosine deaminase [Saprospiraceae bacterium]